MPKRTDIQKILVIGSGPIVIGQAAEFDYAGTQACLALREEGYEVVLANSNPATIMTDTAIADKVYMEPLTPEYVARIIRYERPDAIVPGIGGQTGLNLVMQLEEQGVLHECQVEVLGTRFNVNADERHDVFSTALMRGSVRVSSLADPQQQVVLKPHEKVQLSGGQLSLRTSDDPNEYLWAEGLISVSGRSFADILHRFEHCYGVRFDVKLDRMPDIEAMGKIRISDGIEHALRILQRSCSFHYAYDQETSTITIY